MGPNEGGGSLRLGKAQIKIGTSLIRGKGGKRKKERWSPEKCQTIILKLITKALGEGRGTDLLMKTAKKQAHHRKQANEN